jgi:threonine/homoserine/homoserine lactone efflux protein
VSYTTVELLAFGFTAFLLGFSGAIVPGPMLTVSITESFKKGYKAGTSVVFGHVAAETAMVVLLTLGLSQIIGLKAPFIAICVIGGAFLVFMGINLIKSGQGNASVQTTAEKRTLAYGPVYGGIITSLSNPFFFLWWFTVGAAFVFEGLRLAGLVGLAAFLIGHWASDFSWYGFVSICTDRGAAIAGDRTYRLVLLSCGVFLSILGLGFVYNGFINI